MCWPATTPKYAPTPSRPENWQPMQSGQPLLCLGVAGTEAAAMWSVQCWYVQLYGCLCSTEKQLLPGSCSAAVLFCRRQLATSRWPADRGCERCWKAPGIACMLCSEPLPSAAVTPCPPLRKLRTNGRLQGKPLQVTMNAPAAAWCCLCRLWALPSSRACACGFVCKGTGEHAFVVGQQASLAPFCTTWWASVCLGHGHRQHT